MSHNQAIYKAYLRGFVKAASQARPDMNVKPLKVGPTSPVSSIPKVGPTSPPSMPKMLPTPPQAPGAPSVPKNPEFNEQPGMFMGNQNPELAEKNKLPNGHPANLQSIVSQILQQLETKTPSGMALR